MNLDQLTTILNKYQGSNRTFSAYNFGCRVNAAEINLLSQLLTNLGFDPSTIYDLNPTIFLVNTCSVTKKGEIESLSKIKQLSVSYPDSLIIATGCADLTKTSLLDNVITFSNTDKESILENLNCSYSHQIKDKFSHTNRYLLKIQSGCTQMCSYCTVPYKRNYLWSLSINKAVDTVNKAVEDGYEEIIITGVNLDQYIHGFSNLLEALLINTKIKLISFGSIPINCIDEKFISLFSRFPFRVSKFLHIPIQSGSDKILKLMNRPYDKQKIITVFDNLKKIVSPLPQGEMSVEQRGFVFGTDIIVGFPTETESDFQETLELCKTIGFQKIHTFKYSPRPNTLARIYHQNNPKITKEELKSRSQQIRNIHYLPNQTSISSKT